MGKKEVVCRVRRKKGRESKMKKFIIHTHSRI